jgi:hypothetical protein
MDRSLQIFHSKIVISIYQIIKELCPINVPVLGMIDPLKRKARLLMRPGFLFLYFYCIGFGEILSQGM